MLQTQSFSKQIITLLLIVSMITACQNESNSTQKEESLSGETEMKQKSTPSSIEPSMKEINLSSGKTVIVAESHPIGASLSDVSIYFKEDSSMFLSLKEIDPVSQILIGDLDGNKFDEIYLVSTTAGSGNYSTIKGFSSNNDKSFSFILFPDLEEKETQKGGLFEGYEGGDLYKVEKNKLVRSFPVSGKTVTINYILQKTETGYALKVSK
jgi:hypothetical protein